MPFKNNAVWICGRSFIFLWWCLFCSYPQYVFISDNAISQSAGLASRYTENALLGVITDIHFLALSDYLVCTFSSQVGKNWLQSRYFHLEYKFIRSFLSSHSLFQKSTLLVFPITCDGLVFKLLIGLMMNSWQVLNSIYSVQRLTMAYVYILKDLHSFGRKTFCAWNRWSVCCRLHWLFVDSCF